MNLKQTTKPSSFPVTLATVKEHLRLPSSYTTEDNMLNAYLAAAVKTAEDRTNRQLLQATWTLKTDRFPVKFIINKCPVISVDSIKYLDASGIEQTLDSANYILNALAEPFKITPAYGLSWPVCRIHPNSVTVVFKSGYATAADVPANIIAGILLIVDDLFKNRGTVVIGRIVGEIPLTAERLFETERVATL